MSDTIRTLRLTAAPLALVLALPAFAQDSLTLDPVILSGGFSPVEAAAYGRAATVLDAEDLRRRGVSTVQDALRGLPGVSVNSTGAALTSVRIRGGEGRHTLILIDGVSAAAGDQPYYLSGLDIGDVERIEVLRGPQSVYYGSSAASGVINIITRKASETGGHARVELGNGAAAGLGQSIVTDRWRLQGDWSWRDDRGHDVSGGDGDRDGLRRGTLSLSGEWQATGTLSLGFSARRADERYDYDDTDFLASRVEDYVVDSDADAERDERLGTVWGSLDTLDGRLNHRLSWEDTRLRLDQSDGTETRARRRALKYRATLGLDGAVDTAEQTLAFALDRISDNASGVAENRRDTTSGALEYRGAFANGVDVQLGLRHDDSSDFESKTTWNAGLSWRIEGTPWRLHASAGTGLLHPQYYQILGGFGSIGNPNLKPEENRSIDLGVEYSLPDGRGVIDVTWFREKLQDEITYSFLPLPDGTNYYNETGESRREGIEVAIRQDVTDALTLGAAYTYLDAESPNSAIETRRPRHELALNASLQTFGGRGWVAADLRHVRDMADTLPFGSFETRELPDFTTVNLAASYDMTETARLSARITNLFDKDYQESWGYAAPGRAGWLGIETRW
ncbi:MULTISPECIES: TonB-dependent siderophore receptor [unclassified Paracoccus (in: a-proteobacteria)]|uniref:TonB-dependent receptor plug domain-containing protein n=1 Tax=unclassified Paracoccus (in: a-proteobacteria) TaxID=2688777 RepID=UPI00160108D0|nr:MULTISPECIES: TonB-dependent receptor [unclassified Paracoccus (in: a-proteobacteria)]MBB1490723.1 TonB-dependent receptor [Paracoccus sp. MC1854]MBB1497434.1 TonB-dependent receptor [Paracoccus sp. MC1862]QQO45920.1 TonB-dependent receptor [Paracoccus sp. MC1862]